MLISTPALAGQITFGWDAPAESPTAYKLYYGKDPGTLDRVEDIPGSATEHTIKGLPAGDVVFAQITAINAQGEESKRSGWAGGIVARDPAPEGFYLQTPNNY